MVERKKDEVMQAADDVATLYSWANLHGAKYRDFSASRQELRAQSRHRMLAEQDALAQEAVEKSVKENAKPAEISAPPEAAATLETAPKVRTELRPEMRPLSESTQRPPRATVQYERMPATSFERKPEPAPTPTLIPVMEATPAPAQNFAAPEVSPERTPERPRAPQYAEPPYREQIRESHFREVQFQNQPYQNQPYQNQPYQNQPYQNQPYQNQDIPDQRYRTRPPVERRSPNRGPELAPAVERRGMNREPDFNMQARPGWPGQESESIYGAPAGGSETLQQSRERVASRWFALKGVFDHQTDQNQDHYSRNRDVNIPVVAVFSLAGGVGKTSLVATLGRSLAALGERVLLADTSSYGLLPYYFGARDLRPGVVRTFSSPDGGSDASVNLLNVDVERHENDSADMDWLADDLQRNARGSNRILIDLATASASLTRRALRTTPVVLVPIIPDMNSIVTLNVVDGFFRNHQNAEGRPVQPYYILNQFDPSMPLHLDVREVLRQQLGDRLLPFVLRRSQAVSEALAEGMTVVDYAPNSPLADDYLHLANWLRSVSAPASAGFRGMRWSER
jgi:cellulose synthase operon protein YhjQ